MLDSPDSTRPAFWIITASLCFAVMGAFTHALGARCDWLTVALARAVFMFVATVVMARSAGVALVFGRPRTLWVRSVAGSLSLLGTFYALTRLPLGDVLTLTNTYPLWIVVVSWFARNRRPSPGDALRVTCGLAGVILIERPHFSGDQFAAVVALAASVFTAAAMLGLHTLRGVDPRAVVAHFAGVASVIVAAVMIARAAVDGPVALEGSATLAESAAATPLLLLGVAVLGTIGQVFLTRAYAAGAPTRVSVLALTQVVFGLALDVLVWHRAVSLASLAGTALVLAPTAWLLANAPIAPSRETIGTETA